jgi:3-hydroxyisobutyrate dehydrogenase
MTEIVLIGLGNMGAPMAANLSKAGYKVTGFDVSPSARHAATDLGLDVVEFPAEAIASADIVITMLPNGALVEEVILGPEGVLTHLSVGGLVVDSSTIDVATTKRLHDDVTANGFTFVDAPVSGGVPKAQAGTLTFMVGGTEGAFVRAKPVLSRMGAKIVHAGGPGAGQAAKVCNNMLFSGAMIATCEAFLLAEKLGLQNEKLFDILSSSSGDTWALHNFTPLPGLVPGSAADEGYVARFAASLMSKDLGLALGAAAEAGLTLPVSEVANQLYAEYAAAEGHLDTSGIIRQLRRRNN